MACIKTCENHPNLCCFQCPDYEDGYCQGCDEIDIEFAEDCEFWLSGISTNQED